MLQCKVRHCITYFLTLEGFLNEGKKVRGGTVDETAGISMAFVVFMIFTVNQKQKIKQLEEKVRELGSIFKV